MVLSRPLTAPLPLQNQIAVASGRPAAAAPRADPLLGPLLVHCQNGGREGPLPGPRAQLLQGGARRLHLLLCVRADAKPARGRDVLMMVARTQ